MVNCATGTAEREAALALLDAWPLRPGATLGADKAYDVGRFRQELRQRAIEPDIARRREYGWGNQPVLSPPGYEQSQRHRKRIEEVFAWVKTIAVQAKTAFRRQPRVEASFTLAVAAYNLIRMPKLLEMHP